MPRPFTGIAQLQAARDARTQAKTADELRVALAVLLPLEVGLSLEQTALILGRSKRATCSMRTHFCAHAEGREPAKRSKKELRNRAKNSLEQEAAALDLALSGARDGAILVIPEFKEKIEAALGHSMSLSSVYRLLARHGWRKLAPDTQHPKGDEQAREDWKKNSPAIWKRSPPASAS